MIVLAHGPLTPTAELVLTLPAVALLVLAVGAVRRRRTGRVREDAQQD